MSEHRVHLEEQDNEAISLKQQIQTWRIKLENTSGFYIIGVCLLIACGVLFLIFNINTSSNQVNADNKIPIVSSISSQGLPSSNAVETTSETQQIVTIHIVGEVVYPGLYEVPNGSRMIEAINASGGFTEEADVDQLNLAEPIIDGSQIWVPKVGDNFAGPLVKSPDVNVSAAESKVNLNRSSANDLERLPGVGPSTAQAIVDYREKNGSFVSIEQLVEVKGIGESKLESIREYVFL